MRRLAVILAALLAAMLLPWGCGESNLTGELVDLLRRRSGGIDTISYVCVTEDGELRYREEFEISFPDHYRYFFYDYADGQARLLDVTIQAAGDLYRASAVLGESNEIASLEVEKLSQVPPLRCTGSYLAVYHLIGNVDYFQSMISMLQGGSLKVVGRENMEGLEVYHLSSADGLSPRLQIWVDAESGLAVRKELTVAEDRVVVFRFEDFEENKPYAEEPFPPDTAILYGLPPEVVTETVKDGACRPIDLQDAPAVLGFNPLVPQMAGFNNVQAWWRNPADSTLVPSEQSVQYPADFMEFYLVLRNGAREVEIRENSYDPEFGYYTAGIGALSGAFLTQQEGFGEDTGNASYTAAIDCQEMRLLAGNLEITVTGDLSREEFEALAVQLQELAHPTE